MPKPNHKADTKQSAYSTKAGYPPPIMGYPACYIVQAGV